MAAEKVARIAVGIEYEPRYVDVAILRWERMTKLEAILAGDGRSFEDIGSARAMEIEKPNANDRKPAGRQSPPDSAADDPKATVSSAEQARGGANRLQQGGRS